MSKYTLVFMVSCIITFIGFYQFRKDKSPEGLCLLVFGIPTILISFYCSIYDPASELPLLLVIYLAGLATFLFAYKNKPKPPKK